jgi:hypothetical protein
MTQPWMKRFELEDELDKIEAQARQRESDDDYRNGIEMALHRIRDRFDLDTDLPPPSNDSDGNADDGDDGITYKSQRQMMREAIEEMDGDPFGGSDAN